MMSVEFPQSRVSSSGQCQVCKTGGGMMQKSKIYLPDAQGKSSEYLKWTCNLCGHTMFFDMGVVRSRPLQNSEFKELLPE